VTAVTVAADASLCVGAGVGVGVWVTVGDEETGELAAVTETVADWVSVVATTVAAVAVKVAVPEIWQL
jgi:hypothetical protein